LRRKKRSANPSSEGNSRVVVMHQKGIKMHAARRRPARKRGGPATELRDAPTGPLVLGVKPD